MGGTARPMESAMGVEGESASTPALGFSDFVRLASKSVFALADVFSSSPTGPRLLIYHQVERVEDSQMIVTPETFEAQLDWISSRGEIVRLEDALRGDEFDRSDRFVLTFDDGYDGVYRYAFPLMLDRGIPFTIYLTSGFVDGPGAGPGLKALTWTQVREMVSSGLVTVGAHTESHPDLRTIEAVEIAKELDRSNRVIADQTGIEPRHFAYPKGYWAETAELLIRERYDTATLGAGEPIGRRTDMHRLSRVPVQRSDGMVFFKRKALRGMWLEEWVRRRVKGYRNPESTRKSPGGGN